MRALPVRLLILLAALSGIWAGPAAANAVLEKRIGDRIERIDEAFSAEYL